MTPVLEIDRDAADYISRKSGSVVINFKLEPAIGG